MSSTSSPVRAAIVGCGGIANVHARSIQMNPDHATLIACADIDRSRAAALAEKYDANGVYEDYREMIEKEKPELLVVSTWAMLHEEQVIEAAKRGVPAILCEKSLAMSAEGAARMAAAAKESAALVVEGHMYRHHPRTLELQRLVREGRIGRLRKIRSVFQRQALEGSGAAKKMNPAYGGVVGDFTTYCMNGVGAFTAELPIRVQAEWERQGELITELHGLLRYADGLVAIVESSYTSSYQQPLELSGETGILRMQDAWVGNGSQGIEYDPNERPTRIERIETPKLAREHAQLQHVCQCLRSGGKPRMTIEESVRNQCVIDAMLESARRGEPVTPRLPSQIGGH